VQDADDEFTGDYVYKVLKNPARLDRFILEIDVTNALFRAGLPVLRVVDYATSGAARAFMVTPFVARGDLRAYMASGVFTNDLAFTLTFVDRLAAILKKVHETSVHRDLKPENILIGDDGHPILCDFGLCLPLWEVGDNTRNSDTLEQIGSRHYIAPEALGGYPLVKNLHALDAYSLGKIAYELAAGRMLPGVARPEGEYDLALAHPGADDWYLFNALVSGLVDHDPSQRMDSFERLPKMIELARRRPASGEDLSPDAFETAVARGLYEHPEARKAKRVRDFYAMRDSYYRRLVSAIADAFASDPRVQRLRQLSADGDQLVLEYGEASGTDWVPRLTSYPALGHGEFRDGSRAPVLSVRLRIGGTPAEDRIPTLATDVVWRNEGADLRIIFALYVAKYAPIPPGGVIAASEPEPHIAEVDWAGVGDETYVAEARTRAADLAARFATLVLHEIR
jgi:tRNA A-37 threonylcarbamoyl transferase component Bud32